MLKKSRYIYSALLPYLLLSLHVEAKEMTVETIYQGTNSVSGVGVWIVGLVSIILVAVFAVLFLKEKNDDKDVKNLSADDFKIIEDK